ncbi:MAG: EpsD family peptidyl-prolyl cis-trans isomerase [Burkholderiales bacterium]|nr:EpsD family peptidyl-prolyl cis-trans isomerase [Burkholderiales bacterium]
MRHATLTAVALAATLLLAACTGHKKDATQAAARVDGAEITVHQINYRLQRERGLRPEQQDAASHKILEQLIDEQLLVEKAEKVKMDKEPGAQQAVDAARREVLARAYMEQSAQSVPAPTDAAVHAYFEDNDALFAHRRVYTLQEYLAKLPEDRIPALRALVEGGKSPAEVEAWFKAQGVQYRGQETTQPAERIPLNSLKTLATIPDGHGLVASAGNQVHVTYVASSVLAPVDYARAKPAIGQFLSVEARRKATEGNLGALRSVAKVTYAAPYQALAVSASTFSIRDVEAASHAVEASGTRVSLPTVASSGVQVSLPAATATSGVRVSLPSQPASRVEVRLPPPPSGDATKK